MIRKLLALAAVILVAIAIFLYWIDQRVKTRLASLNNSTLPTIYSAPLDIAGFISRLEDDPGRAADRIRAILGDRRYSEVNGSPSSPGEYAIRDATLSIITREFRTAGGTTSPSKRASLPFARGIGAKGTGPNNTSGNNTAARGPNPPATQDPSTPLLIEPQAISFLGADSVRASTFVPLSQIPEIVKKAVIGIEDERFYDHHGIDIIGIGRAIITNVLAFRLVQGGSTLTQQLAKNLILSPKRTLTRKLMEIPSAFSLERQLSKEKLLELYLNEVYLGQEGAVALHGVPEAASAFFGKRVQDLTIDEAAVLAGIIKAPSTLSPRHHPDRAKARRDIVLTKMRELEFITAPELAAALKRPIKVVGQVGHRRVAPHFTTALENELSQSIDLAAVQGSGLAVYTGLELGMQECAEKAVADGLKRLEAANPRIRKKDKELQAAIVSIEPYSGLVKAWVGGRDFSESQFNRVNQGKRQIGSTVKPFLYLTALDGSLNSYKVATASSILEDKPMAIAMRRQATWIPENYDRTFEGDVSLRHALESSLNMPAIYVAERVGIPALKKTLEIFEVGDSLQNVPALALGATDSTLLHLTAAYGALANSGVFIQPRLFVSATDDHNEHLATSEIREKVVADENAVYVLTDILRGVIERGTGKSVRSRGFLRPAAGKTGTSDKARDAWFIGFTPNLVTGVWIGFDDNSPLGATGGGASAPMWADFMRCSSPYVPEANFIQPRGVVGVDLDSTTGDLATPECPRELVVREIYVAGTEPTRRCDAHYGGARPPDRDDDREPRLPRGEHDSEERDVPPRKRDKGFWESLFG